MGRMYLLNGILEPGNERFRRMSVVNSFLVNNFIFEIVSMFDYSLHVNENFVRLECSLQWYICYRRSCQKSCIKKRLLECRFLSERILRIVIKDRDSADLHRACSQFAAVATLRRNRAIYVPIISSSRVAISCANPGTALVRHRFAESFSQVLVSRAFAGAFGMCRKFLASQKF